MYLEHFGLNEYPFALTPDTSFFFDNGSYRDAYQTLFVAIASGEGFIKLVGEVGTGKTTLCRRLLNNLGDEYHTCYIPNPDQSSAGLLRAVADELGLHPPDHMDLHRVQKLISDRLLEISGEKAKQVVLLIDEAQAMSIETMEALRLLTNLETEKRKLVQVVLFGQPELDEKLNKRVLRRLRQRITFSHHLSPIARDDLAAYIQHRLGIAGSKGQVSFDRGACRQIFYASQGTPRLINILAHKSMLVCYGRGERIIRSLHVKRAVADTEMAKELAGARQRHHLLVVVALLAMAALAATTLYLMEPLLPFLGGLGL